MILILFSRPSKPFSWSKCIMCSSPEPGIYAHGGGGSLSVTHHRQTHTDNISRAFRDWKNKTHSQENVKNAFSKLRHPSSCSPRRTGLWLSHSHTRASSYEKSELRILVKTGHKNQSPHAFLQYGSTMYSYVAFELVCLHAHMWQTHRTYRNAFVSSSSKRCTNSFNQMTGKRVKHLDSR